MCPDKAPQLLIVLCVASITMLCQCHPKENAFIVASYRGGTVTLAEVERVLLSTREGRHARNLDSLIQMYRDTARDIAFASLLAAEQDSQNSPVALSSLARIRHRDTRAESFYRRYGSTQPPPGTAAIEAYYAEHPSAFTQPARRKLTSLFIPQTPVPMTQAQLNPIEERFFRNQTGNPMPMPGSAKADSLDWLHGWLVQGSLPANWEREVFSKGLDYRDTIHSPAGTLFVKTTQVSEPALQPLAQVQAQIKAKLIEAQALRQIESLATLLPWPEGTLFMDRAGFDLALDQGKADALLFKIGDLELKLADFLAWANQAGIVGNAGDELWTFYRQTIEKQRLFLLMDTLGSNFGASPHSLPVTVNFGDSREEQEMSLAERMILRHLKQEVDTLRAYGDQHPRLLLSTPRYRVTCYSVTSADKDRFIEAAVALNQVRKRLQENPNQAVSDLRSGVHLERLGWLSEDQLKVRLSLPDGKVTQLREARFSGPFLLDRALVLVQAEAYEPAKTRPFSEVLDEIAQAYLEEHHQGLRDRFKEDQLTRASFTFHRDRLRKHYQRMMSQTPESQ